MTLDALSADDDVLSLLERSGDEARVESTLDAGVWKILIVDDDEGVHRATTFAVGSRKLQGRDVMLLHARSADEAMRILRADRHIAVAIVDVVMEEPQAGLALVAVIRETLCLRDMRIILRTGQPGSAPEIEAVTRYDINDYHSKLELTQGRLIAALTTALRTYEQLSVESDNRRALEVLATLAPRRLASENVPVLFQSFVDSLHEIVSAVSDAAILDPGSPQDASTTDAWMVAAGAGRFSGKCGSEVSDLLDRDAMDELTYVRRSGRHHGGMLRYAVPIAAEDGSFFVLWVEADRPLRRHEMSVLDVACITASAALKSVITKEHFRRVANEDAATGLCSRSAFERACRESVDADVGMAVLLVELERLDDIRDTMGSTIGDDLLRAAAARIGRLIPSIRTTARFASSTVACLVSSFCGTPSDVFESFEEPLSVAGYSMHVAVSVGHAEASTASAIGLDLVSAASLALSAARRSDTRRVRTFERALFEETRTRLARIEALRNAVAHDELELHYQPQVDIATGRPFGVEALVRWRRSSGELVPPLAFIDVAEQSGLIVPIGEWVLNEACRQLRAWDSAGLPPLRMAVNVSVAQFNQAEFPATVAAALAKHNTDPSRVELELTESVGVHDLIRARDMMNEVRLLGVNWALDDFGIGYSSLGYLRSLPISRLKIDRLFTAEIRSRTEGVAIPKMIIDLARELGLEVVAEGVETQDVADALLSFGCRIGQGFHYARPLPATGLQAFIARGEPSSAGLS